MLAPRSSTTESPRIVGHTPAMAGRSIPGMVCRWKRAIAIRAPVLPAETATSASFFFTASIASHIDEFLRPRRSAWPQELVDVGHARGLLQGRIIGELRF